MNSKLVSSLILLVIAVTFILQNTEVVDVHILFWTLSASRAFFTIFLFAVGLVVGWLMRGQSMKRKLR